MEQSDKDSRKVYMEDVENTQAAEVAPQASEAQSEQVATTETVDNSPVETAAETEERLLAGKFKSPEDLEKAYQEVQSLATRTAQENARMRQAFESQNSPADVNQAPELDPDMLPALNNWFESTYAQRREIERAQEFAARHAEELQDPLLQAQVEKEIRDGNARGEFVDQEAALAKAKKLLDARLTPKVKAAQSQGIEEGQQIARNKELAGAIGSTHSKVPTDDTKLSAADLEKKLNIPRFN